MDTHRRHANVAPALGGEPSDESARSSYESSPRKPGGFPHFTLAFVMLVLVGLAALTLSALHFESVYVLAVVGISIPVLIYMLARSAARRRERRQHSS